MYNTIKRDKKNIFLVLLTIFTAITIGINLDKTLSLAESFSGNSFYYVVIAIFSFCAFQKVFTKRSKRLVVCVLALSVLLTLFEIIGFTIDSYADLSAIFVSKTALLKNILKSGGLFVIIYSALILLFDFIDLIFNKKNNDLSINEKSDSLTKSEFKSKRIKRIIAFFIIWIVLFCAYIPTFLDANPGILSFDSTHQINQSIGAIEMTGQHPAFHTFIIKICISLGFRINGTFELGVAIYSICQMLFMSGVFAFALYYMNKKNINIYLQIITFLFFLLYPVFPMYSVTMWKDVPFGLIMVLVIITLIELVYNQDKFIKSKFYNILWIIILLVAMLIKNNGYHIILLSIPFIIWVARKNWKRCTLLMIITLVAYNLITGPLLSALNIPPSEAKHALSVPIQQIARVQANKYDELSEEELTQIYKFIEEKNIKSIYDPYLSDPIKNVFVEKYFADNKMEFITLWIKLFFKYPVQYFESFFCNSVGYWYPETNFRVLTTEIYNFPYGASIERTPMFDEKLLKMQTDNSSNRQLPLYSMTLSIGFNMWVMLVGITYLVYKKRYRELLVFVPIIMLWFTTLASPVHCEYRYIFGLFTCMPILIALTINGFRGSQKSDEK